MLSMYHVFVKTVWFISSIYKAGTYKYFMKAMNQNWLTSVLKKQAFKDQWHTNQRNNFYSSSNKILN